jgi:hypothetical protein
VDLKRASRDPRLQINFNKSIMLVVLQAACCVVAASAANEDFIIAGYWHATKPRNQNVANETLGDRLNALSPSSDTFSGFGEVYHGAWDCFTPGSVETSGVLSTKRSTIVSDESDPLVVNTNVRHGEYMLSLGSYDTFSKSNTLSPPPHPPPTHTRTHEILSGIIYMVICLGNLNEILLGPKTCTAVQATCWQPFADNLLSVMAKSASDRGRRRGFTGCVSRSCLVNRC